MILKIYPFLTLISKFTLIPYFIPYLDSGAHYFEKLNPACYHFSYDGKLQLVRQPMLYIACFGTIKNIEYLSGIKTSQWIQ